MNDRWCGVWSTGIYLPSRVPNAATAQPLDHRELRNGTVNQMLAAVGNGALGYEHNTSFVDPTASRTARSTLSPDGLSASSQLRIPAAIALIGRYWQACLKSNGTVATWPPLTRAAHAFTPPNPFISPVGSSKSTQSHHDGHFRRVACVARTSRSNCLWIIIISNLDRKVYPPCSQLVEHVKCLPPFSRNSSPSLTQSLLHNTPQRPTQSPPPQSLLKQIHTHVLPSFHTSQSCRASKYASALPFISTTSASNGRTSTHLSVHANTVSSIP